MMKKLLIVLTAVTALTGFRNTEPFAVTDGEKVGDLELTMTVQKAIEKYGKPMDFTEGITDGEYDAWYTNRFYFSNGIVVFSTTIESSWLDDNLPSSIIDQIGIIEPADATTEKGINLKTGNLDQILKAYGEPDVKEKDRDHLFLHYRSHGISFDCRADKSIEKMAVYRPGDYPIFYYRKDDIPSRGRTMLDENLKKVNKW